MKEMARLMKLLSDPARLRILLLLTARELCVCQIMGILGISQPMVSKNLKLLDAAGLLQERKKGKLVFYSIDQNMQERNSRLISLLKELLEDDQVIRQDIRSMEECAEYQKECGKCDMKTFLSYMEKKRNRR